jgi:hypothetical protein
MSATGTQDGATHRGEPGVGTMLFVDLRARYLLLGEARKRVVTRALGIPRAEQSFLATAIVIGAAATVLRDLAPRPLPWPKRSDAAIGGSLANAGLRGLAGEPSAAMPLAGALIAFGLLSKSLRPTIVGSAHEVRSLTRDLRSALSARYTR